MPDPVPPDSSALARMGEAVRKRLDADPATHRAGVDNVELYALSGFLSPQECAHLINLIDATAKPSSTYDGGSYRTSWSGDVDPTDSFVKMIERRLCDLLGIDHTWGETFQGQRYQPGQEFRGHFDWFQTDSFYWPEESHRGGQRSWTAMVYLNDVEAGGETVFPEIGATIAPQQGTLLMWNNATPEGQPNHKTLHAAMPVIAGTKYVITKWFRTRPWG